MSMRWTEEQLAAHKMKRAPIPPKKPRKYRNTPTMVDGIEFDSAKEAARWRELKLVEKAGDISGLCRQVRFMLVPSQKGELPLTYVADFVYFLRGKLPDVVIEDVKGMRTRAYLDRRKLMLHQYGIVIKEI